MLYNKLRKTKHGPVTITDIVIKPTVKVIKIVCSFLAWMYACISYIYKLQY